jgi:drug/metabolite transporter (DMT)-like permease
MSDPGPLPPPPRRPRWLLFLLGFLGLCLLICVLFYIWTQTAGREVVTEIMATVEAAVTQTANQTATAVPNSQ